MNSAYRYSKNTESDMMRLWDKHQDVVNDVINKYRFIEHHAREDYRQEMFIRVFEKFYQWPECQNKGIGFTSWLYIRCRNAAINYRRQTVRSRDNNIIYYGRYKYTDKMESLLVADENYEEDDLTALSKAVSDLEPGDQKVIQMFYNGEKFEPRSRAEGKPKDYYSQRFIRIRNRLRVVKGRYWEDRAVFIKRYPNMARSCAVKAAKRRKCVLQISLQGNIVKEWESIADVWANGFNRRSLKRCINGKECSYGGFIWLFKSDIEKLPERLKRISANGGGKQRVARPVEQWSADGELIKIWPSLLSTKDAGFSPGNIHTNLKKGIMCKGYRWRYTQTESAAGPVTLVDQGAVQIKQHIKNDYNSDAVLLKLWQGHQSVVNRVLFSKKYSFILPHERDDYRQEIFIRIWQSYNNWVDAKSQGIEFGSWLYTRSVQAIFEYRRKQVHCRHTNTNIIFHGRLRYMENMDLFLIPDEQYNEDDLIGLRNAISDLSQYNQQVVQLFYDDNIVGNKLSKRFFRVKEMLRENKSKYWENERRYKGVPGRAKLKNEQSPYSKPVLQIDFSGNIIKEWPSTAEAGRNGFCRASVVESANGGTAAHRGFIWLYASDINKLADRLEWISRGAGVKNVAMPIDQFSLDGKFIKRWPSLQSTRRGGFDPSNLVKIVGHPTRIHKGYRWRYVEAAKNSEQVAA